VSARAFCLTSASRALVVVSPIHFSMGNLTMKHRPHPGLVTILAFMTVRRFVPSSTPTSQLWQI
jgi:hypothetical protein